MIIPNSGYLKCFRDFPGGTVDKNLTANAGDTGSSPGLGRTHMPQLLKPTHLETVLSKNTSHRNEKPMHRNRVAPARHN